LRAYDERFTNYLRQLLAAIPQKEERARDQSANVAGVSFRVSKQRVVQRRKFHARRVQPLADGRSAKPLDLAMETARQRGDGSGIAQHSQAAAGQEQRLRTERSALHRFAATL